MRGSVLSLQSPVDLNVKSARNRSTRIPYELDILFTSMKSTPISTRNGCILLVLSYLLISRTSKSLISKGSKISMRRFISKSEIN